MSIVRTQAPLPRFIPRLSLHALLLVLSLASPALRAQLVTPNLGTYVNGPYAQTQAYNRFGTPMTFTARVLPADATGTVTFVFDNVPVQTVPLTTQTLGDYNAVGDSLTAANYIADPSQRYSAIVGQTLGLNTNRYGIPGYTSCDEMNAMIIPNGLGLSTTSHALFSLMLGTNDLNNYGVGAGEQLFNSCDQSALAWLGTSRYDKILIGDPGVASTAGSWTTANIFGQCCTNALTESSGSGTVRFTMSTSGGAAYLWYEIQTSTTGSFAVSVDGGAYGPATSSLMPTSTDALTATVALLRIPVAAGAHTFDIAVQSGTVGIVAMGTAPAAGPSAIIPTVLTTDVLNQLNGTEASQIAVYTADIQSNVALLRSDGLDIRFVPTHQYMFATPAEMEDPRHPNALGFSEIAQAFLSVITPAAPVPDTITLPAASYTSSTLPIGSHSYGIYYSGDSKYAPSAYGFYIVIYDPTSTVALTSDAPVYIPQSPVTLTATVPQANAGGEVTFIDVTGGASVPLGIAWIITGPNNASLTLPSLSAGTHTLMVQYAGDLHYNGSSSSTITVVVSGANTTTSLTAPNTRYDAGAPTVLTAAINPPSATGTVTFLDGASVLTQLPLASGNASFSTSALTPGIHSLTASYSGNSTLDSSVSPILGVEIDLNPTVISLTPLPPTLSSGTALSLKATVSPATASGSITFSDGSQTVGQATLVNGVATLALAQLAAGNHTFTAVYSGDTLDLPSISAAISTQVTLASSSTVLAPIPASIVFGSAVTLSASVTPSTAAGTITFTDSVSGTLAQIGLGNGAISFSAANLSPGIHSLTATYSGDTSHSGSTSPAVTLTVNPVASSIVLAAPPATLAAGNPLSLSASLTPASATGAVTFRDATLGVLGQSSVSHGSASLTLPNPAAGSYNITASYSGDTSDSAATSNTVATQIALSSTSLALTSSANPAPAASSLTLLATLASVSATGTVIFFDGASPIGTAMLANGRATLPISSLATGPHALHATYSGDTLDAASSSASLTQTITTDASTTTLTLAQSSVIAGAPITFNVHVSDPYATPTGTISLRSGTSTLASGSLANASAGSGFATFSVNSTTRGLGTFPVVAFYSGDTNDQPSDSSASTLSVTVTAISTTAALTLSSVQIPIQGATSITATVASPNTVPTGTIAFVRNGTTLATSPLNAAGTASYNLAADALGTFAISAVYSPTGLFATSSTAPVTLVVTAPLSAALSPSSISADPGATSTASLTLTPLSGFTGAIQTLCQTTVSFVTCSLNAPASLTGPTSIPVQISVSRTSAALSTPAHPGALAIALALMLPLLSLRRRLKPALTIVSFLLLSFFLGGCAEGGSFSSVPAGAQTVAITVTRRRHGKHHQPHRQRAAVAETGPQ